MIDLTQQFENHVGIYFAGYWVYLFQVNILELRK